MYCPKCKKEFSDENNIYCPFCGYKLSSYQDDIKLKFSPRLKRIYNLMIALAFFIALLSLSMIIIFPSYYLIFLIFPCLSFLIVRFVSKYIGIIDRENTPSEIISYLKKSSIFVMMTYLINVGIIIYGIVKIIIDAL